jgi:hypothetical protein
LARERQPGPARCPGVADAEVALLDPTTHAVVATAVRSVQGREDGMARWIWDRAAAEVAVVAYLNAAEDEGLAINGLQSRDEVATPDRR